MVPRSDLPWGYMVAIVVYLWKKENSKDAEPIPVSARKAAEDSASDPGFRRGAFSVPLSDM